MIHYDIAVIGGGPAGIMAAIAASQNSSSVVLLEKNPSLGRKLLLTGGGRCNITNLKPIKKLLNQYNNPHFLKHSFFTFTNDDLFELFDERGVQFTVEDNDRVFPVSGKSSDILDALYDCLGNVSVKCNYEVDSISEDFIINDEISTKAIVIATGGVTYPQTGCSIDNYHLTQQPVSDIKYGLSPLITKADVSSIAGVSLYDVGINYRKKIRENVLFSHVGISGPGIFNLSNEISESIDYNLHDGEVELELKITLDFTPDLTQEDLSKKFTKDFQKNGKTYLKNYLRQYLTRNFINYFLDELNLDGEVNLSNIKKKSRNMIIQNLKNFPFEIVAFDASRSKVTVGGVDLEYVNAKTMESKIIPNLYFAGEVLDLHGPTGGYNLKIAFSTGYLAGLSASKKISI